ncbi:SctK family type III secretion system sorting platform protein [Chelatococcus sp. GCM10030263]|uniref:SctK family type III secretion system sorting platform protein n=1 Tax=Chelatococcus sp. GCM10030263 TaxID=3273387 RepID=UPI003614AF76
MTSAAMADPVTQDAWRIFGTEPVRHAHPAWLAASLSPGVTLGICARLSAEPRFHDRLSAQLAAHAALPPWGEIEPDNPLDREIALVSRDALEELVTAAGAVIWADALARRVRREEAAAVRDRLGEDVVRFALANRELAIPGRPVEDIDELCGQIGEDGWRCYAAWCAAQPPAIGKRAVMKCDPVRVSATLPEPLRKAGPAIIRRAAQRTAA